MSPGNSVLAISWPSISASSGGRSESVIAKLTPQELLLGSLSYSGQKSATESALLSGSTPAHCLLPTMSTNSVNGISKKEIFRKASALSISRAYLSHLQLHNSNNYSCHSCVSTAVGMGVHSPMVPLTYREQTQSINMIGIRGYLSCQPGSPTVQRPASLMDVSYSPSVSTIAAFPTAPDSRTSPQTVGSPSTTQL